MAVARRRHSLIGVLQSLLDYVRAVARHVWVLGVSGIFGLLGAVSLLTTTPHATRTNPHPEARSVLPIAAWAWWVLAVVALQVACFRAFHDMRKQRDDLLHLDWFRREIPGMELLLRNVPRTADEYFRFQDAAGRLDHETTDYVTARFSKRDARQLLDRTGVQVAIPGDVHDRDRGGWYLLLAQRRKQLQTHVNKLTMDKPAPVDDVVPPPFRVPPPLVAPTPEYAAHSAEKEKPISPTAVGLTAAPRMTEAERRFEDARRELGEVLRIELQKGLEIERRIPASDVGGLARANAVAKKLPIPPDRAEMLRWQRGVESFLNLPGYEALREKFVKASPSVLSVIAASGFAGRDDAIDLRARMTVKIATLAEIVETLTRSEDGA